MGYAALTVISILGLLPCLGFLIFYAIAVRRAPAWSQSDEAWKLQSIKFVLFRFHGGAYYWGICFLTRSGLVTVATLLKDPFEQVLMLSIVMLVYAVCQCAIWPWKARIVNILDASASALLIVMMISATRLISSDNGGVDKDTVTMVITTSYMAILFLFLGYVIRLAILMCKLRNPINKVKWDEEKTMKMTSVSKSMQELGKSLWNTSVNEMTQVLTSVTEIDLRRLNYHLADLMLIERGDSYGKSRVRLRTGKTVIVESPDKSKGVLSTRSGTRSLAGKVANIFGEGIDGDVAIMKKSFGMAQRPRAVDCQIAVPPPQHSELVAVASATSI